MPNLLPIAFIDTFDIAASLRPRMGKFDEAADGSYVFPLRGRGEGDAFVVKKELAGWPEAKAVLGKLQRLDRGVELGDVFLEMLAPQTWLNWRMRHTDWMRLHLPLRTAPGAIVYSGAESAHLLPGQATVVNQAVPTTAVNFGETSRIHLIVDFKRGEGA